MRYVRIKEGIVLEIIEPFFDDEETEVPIEKQFHPEIVASLVPDPNTEAVVNGTWDGAVFGPVPPPLPEPTSPDDELTAGLAALKGKNATVDQLIDVLLGQAGKKGRVAGRPT